MKITGNCKRFASEPPLTRTRNALMKSHFLWACVEEIYEVEAAMLDGLLFPEEPLPLVPLKRQKSVPADEKDKAEGG